jgi:hypothetical protein
MESPKQNRAWRDFSETIRLPRAWFGFLYGMVMVLGTWHIAGDGSGNFILVSLLAVLYGLNIARAITEIRDQRTLKACLVGALLASTRSMLHFLLDMPVNLAAVVIPLLWDWFLGAFMGYWYLKAPRKTIGAVGVGGIVGGVTLPLLILATESGQGFQYLFQTTILLQVLLGMVYSAYGFGLLTTNLVQLAETNKKRELKAFQQKPFSPAPLASFLDIIPMLTGMVTYKGTGIVRFGALELKVNRTQYQDLKLGLIYKIEYNEHENTLLGYELVSKETPVIGERF